MPIAYDICLLWLPTSPLTMVLAMIPIVSQNQRASAIFKTGFFLSWVSLSRSEFFSRLITCRLCFRGAIAMSTLYL